VSHSSLADLIPFPHFVSPPSHCDVASLFRLIPLEPCASARFSRERSALPNSAPVTHLESTLPRPHESVSKQRTLTLLESALTSLRDSHRKQRTSSPSESTLTQLSSVSHLESTLTKKAGEGGKCSAVPAPVPTRSGGRHLRCTPSMTGERNRPVVARQEDRQLSVL
jgi:hypothetical protein